MQFSEGGFPDPYPQFLPVEIGYRLMFDLLASLTIDETSFLSLGIYSNNSQFIPDCLIGS